MNFRFGRGFSLIELIVVMAIIAILVVIALPRYQGSVESARLGTLRGDLRAMRECIDRFHDDKGRFPASLQELVDAHYLRSIPVDPITDSAATWVPVEEVDNDQTSVVDVKSGARGEAAPGKAYSEL